MKGRRSQLCSDVADGEGFEPASLVGLRSGAGLEPGVRIPSRPLDLANVIGGWGGIRTPGGFAPTPVFKTGALNHSATHPDEMSV